MTSLTEPVTKQTRPATANYTAAQWLDALSTGASDQQTFLRGVGEILERAPDTGWELLALVDQYYRRGKISSATFNHVKTQLQTTLMGKGRTVEISVPLAQADTEPPLPNSAPAARAAVAQRERRVQVESPDDIEPDEFTPAAEQVRPRTEAHGQLHVLTTGDVLRNRYRVQGILGQGGMGTVFEAIDQFRLDWPGNDQRVAVKVLHTEIIQRPRLFAELRREFQHLQSLSHPNIVRVHEFDRDGDIAYFTMEYLSGALLTQVVAAHQAFPLFRPYALAIIRDVGAAVVHAHSRGVVHGDLNPGNIFITDNGEVRVLDFGASHQLRRGPWISDFEDAQQIAVATRSYASCQLLEGEQADARDDVFAMASIIYVLLTGRHPFGEHNALDARTAHSVPKRPRALSRQQWNVLRAGLAFERERRPGDMRTWLAQLRLQPAAVAGPPLSTLLAPRRSRPSRLRPALIAAGVALIVGGVAWLAATHTESL
jgi:eukaryotic-like serine/threonine-protein kinase